MENPLGKKTEYTDQYSPELLFAISRWETRKLIPHDYLGADIWNLYELSWLQDSGTPVVATGQLTVPATSPSLIESKSLKLYLNSFNGTVFANSEAVHRTIVTDLSRALGCEVGLSLETSDKWNSTSLSANPGGECLDKLVSSARPLVAENDGQERQQKYFSHLLRSLCPITGQPDWGTVVVDYSGPGLNPDALLSAIIGLRNHRGFHEDCCEQLFHRILHQGKARELSIGCYFTRRGGIDINVVRHTPGSPFTPHGRFVRQ